MGEAWRSLIRVSSFLRKEIVEVLRQPRLVLTLVLGPFLILLLFAAGLKEFDPPVRTAFVAPEDDRLAQMVEEFAEGQQERLIVEGVTQDEEAALDRLRNGTLDLVVVFPQDAVGTIRGNERATIVLYHNQIDPVETRAIVLFARTAVDQANQQVLQAAVEEGQLEAGDAGERITVARERVDLARAALEVAEDAEAQRQIGLLRADIALLAGAALLVPGMVAADGEEVSNRERLQAIAEQLDAAAENPDQALAELGEIDAELAQLEAGAQVFRGLSPQVIVTPFTAQVERVAAGSVRLQDFYAPAVLVLLMQHMVVTFVGLSVVREEQLGTTELFRIAPLGTVETLLGKYIAYTLISGFVTAALLALLIFGLGVPMAGSWAVLVAGVAAVLFASIGLGFIVALLARTDSQAVQYAMMVLLANIFLSGFLISLERFLPLARGVAWLLPATYGIQLLRSVMLRGTADQPLLLAALVGIGGVLFVLSWVMLRRRMFRA
ncbi:MAG: ABC transporter permease [Euzebyaceae bacterium]|nr:ABC transporter permease [Euzebyaceae bacterium]